MKVGPVDLPVSNASQLLGFALLTYVFATAVNMAPIPAKYNPFKPKAV